MENKTRFSITVDPWAKVVLDKLVAFESYKRGKVFNRSSYIQHLIEDKMKQYGDEFREYLTQTTLPEGQE